MAITSVALNAYQMALKGAGSPLAKKEFRGGASTMPDHIGKGGASNFADTVKSSLEKVNNLQTEKANMIESFASGETQNVHELMIQLQKAGLAMSMTSAVRNKVMEAYKQIMQTQF